MRLQDPLQFLKGVGPKRADALSRTGLRTLEDLLFHLPFRYEDRRRLLRADAAEPGMDATLVGEISSLRETPLRRGRGSMLRAMLSDGSGWLHLIWFRQAAWHRERLKHGGRWLVHGRVEEAPRGGLQIAHPEIEPVPEGVDPASLARIIPVYSKPGELTQPAIRKLCASAVEGCASLAESAVPPPVASTMDLMPAAEALRAAHSPPPDTDAGLLATCATPFHRSLIFEELFTLQVGMLLRRAERMQDEGLVIPRAEAALQAFFSDLPFDPTGAQLRVIGEIAADMASSRPMNRLVQGDVGSGKTVVAFAAALQAVRAGMQAALMAPTELLAEQHAATLRPWAEKQGMTLGLLTGAMKASEARRVRDGLETGALDLVVGTHALVQDTTRFRRLGLAIVDEQHRFGVMQRAALRAGQAETLLLSATPIPRTLSLTLYGDLDVSFLDELPPGRTPIVTKVLSAGSRPKLYERMAAALAEGRQAYLVYPLVEESEEMDLADATSAAQELQAGPFREYRVGLLHGKMRPGEKDAVMRRFAQGDLHVLVATTVIEVGIDVPNATIMVVEHAERFGLAQLHQLRGRVGRGKHESFCCLVAEDARSADAVERLKAMERSTDGFEIAEVDLRLRGPGEYLGTAQSGLPQFRAANLVRDQKLLELAQKKAAEWLERDPGLNLEDSAALRRALSERWGEKLGLAEVG